MPFREPNLPPEEEIRIIHSHLFQERPEEDDFEGVYSQDKIAKDKENLEKRKRGFGEPTENAKFLEDAFGGIAEANDWFGENSRLIRTSEYDDVMNGIDYVVEWEDEAGQVTRLGIDLTTSGDLSELKEKFDRILVRVRKNELGRCDYFSHQDIKGKIECVPQVVIQVENEQIKYLANKILMKGPDLSKHYLQKDILEITEIALEAEIRYAQGSGCDKRTIESLQRALGIISNLRKEKNAQKDIPPSDFPKSKLHRYLSAGILI